MAPIENSKWVVLRELARFPEDEEVADAMRRAEELVGQLLADAAAFVAATEAAAHAEEEKRLGEVCQVINSRMRTVVGLRQAEEEAWALVTVVASP
jgi:hypothetical protein